MWRVKALLQGMPPINAGPTLLDDANAIAAASPGAIQQFWMGSLTIDRQSATLSTMAAMLNITSADLDTIFIAAAQVVP
jgi:uncharacterized RDD family membrane protein YckC